MIDHAATIEQHQRVTCTDSAQVNARHVAARRVHTADQIGCRVEIHITHLRNGAQKIVTINRANAIDLVFPQHRDRQRAVDLSAHNLRTDHLHTAERTRRIFNLLRNGVCNRRARIQLR